MNYKFAKSAGEERETCRSRLPFLMRFSLRELWLAMRVVAEVLFRRLPRTGICWAVVGRFVDGMFIDMRFLFFK